MSDKERLEQTNARYLERITKLENEVRSLTCEKRTNDDYIEMLEDDKRTINNHKVFHMQKNRELEQQNKRYREVMVKLQGFVKRGENECNIKQLIMKLTDRTLEGEIDE